MTGCHFAKEDKVDGKLLSQFNVNDLKALKQELAELLEEDAKYDKLRSLPLYSKVNFIEQWLNLSQFSLGNDRTLTLEWVQGRIQEIILNNVTTDWSVYDDD
jgi:hypothetical protein